MTTMPLRPELIAFLGEYVLTLGQLELLVFLHSVPNRTFSVASANSMLRSNSDYVRQSLLHFVSKRLVIMNEPGTEFQYKPASENLVALVDELVSEYKIRPLRIVEVITNRSTNQMLGFMDAFRIVKGEKSEDR